MRKVAYVIIAVLLAALGWLAAGAARAPALAKQERFPQLTMEQLSAEQRPLAEAIMRVSSVGLGGPYKPLLRSPVLGQRMSTGRQPLALVRVGTG